MLRSSAYFQWNIIDWLSTALLPANRERVVLGAVGRNTGLQHDPIADAPPVFLGEAVADDTAGAIGEERLLLVRRQQDLRIHPQVALGIDGELPEEILRILVDAAEPVRPGDVLHAGRAADDLAVTGRHREDHRRRSNRDEPLRRARGGDRVETVEHGTQRGEQEHGERDAQHCERRPPLAAPRTLEDEADEFHSRLRIVICRTSGSGARSLG
jgi:hypothetical protein